ncbi:c-type cytochrome [Hydrogenophaga sp. MI9]|uniref:c-type cytochrome n=1 Tax=Hydrogenophaga sp. MI9 TaxID=3453719 RepID=UPI003EF02C1D
MKPVLRWSLATLLAATAATATAEVAQVRVWAAACATCHGTDGRALDGMPALAGRDRDELLHKLLDFKNGRQSATLMHQLSRGYTDEQLRDIATYFAGQTK